MTHRQIFSRGRSNTVELTLALQTIFALELMHPSQSMFLVSPWISNATIISNHVGQFRSLIPEAPRGEIRLAQILSELARRGTLIRIICRPKSPYNDEFKKLLPENIKIRWAEPNHIKGLITQNYYLRGSMNFTYSGIKLNDEQMELTNDPELVSNAWLNFEEYWEGLE